MDLLLRLMIAHVLTDFCFQPSHWVEEKSKAGIKSKYFWYHIGLTTLVAAAMTWNLIELWYVPLGIGVTHFFIDWWKIASKNPSLNYFIWDQVGHVTVIVILSQLATYGMMDWDWLIDLMSNHKWWALILAYLIVVFPSGIIISKATYRWRKTLTVESNDRLNSASLEKAGIWIGRLERILVLTFILIGEYSGIGFLIAAKSILRFNSEEGRRQSEYVLVGTLMSFTIAILIGLLVKFVIPN